MTTNQTPDPDPQSITRYITTTFDEVIVPLLAEAHDQLAAQRARHGKSPDD